MTADAQLNVASSHSKPKHIIIVGGSLGGLFTGVALKQHGYNTTILERNPTNLLENQGAGIVAGGDMLAFFERYDRCKRPVAVASQKRMYLDKSGEVVHEEVMKQTMTSWDLCYYMLRANYDHQDSGYCRVPGPQPGDGRIDYRYGCTVTDFKEEDDTVRVFYDSADGKIESVVGDMLVGADGPSSTIRKILCPDVERKYAGYCVIRGTVPEGEASEEAKTAFVERFTFFHAPGIQNLTYTIPGTNGSMEKGGRLLNFVWYTNFPEGDQDLEEVMTDKQGKRRRITIPPGQMREEAWEMVKMKGRDRLPPQMSEMVEKTRQPFVQCITDVITLKNSYMNGKVVLVGDALAGFRPHTVASTSQAAFDVLMLVEYLQTGNHAEFVRRTMEYARMMQSRGVYIGNRSQFESLPLKDYIDDRNMMSIKREDLDFPEWTQVRV
ncbi:monooxygenase [Exophiala viscosa]|uniref:Monooxygenase n=1 Tax=Exophiala viscosa TaxID=2486360 RepID=A0AAN6IF82_9EURO|nr:monooxygenase [Exophiala viscosa]KAI1626388.1 monooxygenase [Exophiala viscosa]